CHVVQRTANVSRTMYDNSVQHTKIQDNPVQDGPVQDSRRATTSSGTGGIVANGLGKRFGDLWALRNLDLHVAPGTVLGLLGHKGADKTTPIRNSTTLSQPTEGSSMVFFLIVFTKSSSVRARVGLANL